MMIQLATLPVALRGILANRLRSFLTILGVILGIASVIALTSVGEGSKQMVLDRIGDMGSNVLTVSPGSSSSGFVRGGMGSATTLTYEDAQAIAGSEAVTAVSLVAPVTSTSGQIIAGSNNDRSRIYGVTPVYEEVHDETVAEGQFIQQTHVDSKSSVCVLGSSVAETLFPDGSALGQTVKLSNRLFTVIGVLESTGTSMTSSDNSVFVPITTVMYRLDPERTTTGDHVISTIYLQATKSSKNDLAIEQVTAVLREEHDINTFLGDEDDFTVTSMQEIEETLTETSDTLTVLLTVTATIALLVAGIGIMNIMLVSVTERTREIGIRKAVGAKRRHILTQFVLEASSISIVGGLIGIGVGIGASNLLSGTIKLNREHIETSITPESIVMAFAVAIAIGIVAGVYPAFRASRLNPIDALRYE